MYDLLKSIDYSLFIFLNQTISNPVFDFVMPIVTNERFLIFTMLCVVVFIGIKHKRKGWIVVSIAIMALVINDFVTAQILKPFFGRIRPSHMEGLGNLLVGKGGKFSFPSNHASNAFAATLVLQYIVNARGKYILFFVALLIAFSRIYVGVHYPADVFVGIIEGSIIGFIALLFLKNRIQGKHFE